MSRTHRKHVASRGIIFGPEIPPPSRRETRVATHLASRAFLPPVVFVADKALFKPGWVPNKKKAGRLPEAEQTRERRLDLLQLLGAEMLESSFDS